MTDNDIRPKPLKRQTTDPLRFLRPAVQFGFILSSILLCLEFRGFVLSLQNPHGPLRHRPPGVEAWLPISSLMSLTHFLRTGIANRVHPAGLVIFTLTLLMALAVRRGFCSWVCPIGAGAEYAAKTGQKLLGRNFAPPAWIDWPLRSLKYLLLGFFLWHILGMSVEELDQFIHGPYNRIADIKMYLFFRNISLTGIVVLLILGAFSVLIENFWCRYLCPYGALLGLFSWLSPVAVRRNADTCIGCGLCTRSCPNRIKVDQKETVRSALCTACYNCIRACKVPGALTMGTRQRRLRLTPVGYALVTVLAFLLAAQVARSLGYWHSDTPPDLYRCLYSQIAEIGHP